MGVVGKSPNQRRKASVKAPFSQTRLSSCAAAPAPQETAAYIAQISGELAHMARGANLGFLAQLLAMAQAEAENVADQRSDASR